MSNSSDDSQNHEKAPPGVHEHSEEEHEHGEGGDGGSGGHQEIVSLAPALDAARLGLKSKVQLLVEALPLAHVYVPLSEDIPNTPDGERVEIQEELTFRPHMILNEDHSIFAVAYSEPRLADVMQEALDWQTSEGELKFVCVPASVAFDLAQVNLEGEVASGLVFNPGTEHELVLQSDEVSSLAQGVAIPLVGYVGDLGPGEDDGTSVVEGAAPPPPELLAALEKAERDQPDLSSVTVQTTFNPERDREPHLSIILTLVARPHLGREALADAVMEDAAPHLPAPGYADIVFRDAPN